MDYMLKINFFIMYKYNTKMSTIFIIAVFLLFFIMYIYWPYQESFATDLSIVDPFSLYLHKDISEKEDWWHKTHTRKFYYYHDMVPFHYRE